MRWALSQKGVAELRSWLGRQTLIALDFDGTLAAIVAHPDHAALAASTRNLLASLTERFSCVVISGRARSDVARRLAGIGLAEVIGNHGSEPWIDQAPLQSWTARVIPHLRIYLQHIPGVSIEDKRSSVSIHYRRVFHRPDAIRAIRRAAVLLRAGAIIPGKFVMSILPPGAFDKGQGLSRAMDVLGLKCAVFIGDDATDEPAFALGSQRKVLGVRVGYRHDSAARLYLKTQREMDLLLRVLIET